MSATEIQRLGFDEKAGRYRVTVYQRALKAKPAYYARFTLARPDLANKQRHITVSLKTDNYDLALERARQKYAELTHKESLGIALKPMTVRDVVEKFIHQYKEGVDAKAHGYSASMYSFYRTTVVAYFIPYLGTRDVNSVRIEDMQQYDIWRRTYAREAKNRHQAAKTEISSRTVQGELNAFKAVLRWAGQRGYYQGKAYEYTHKNVTTSKRPAMTIEQYRRLYRYMRTKAFMQIGRFENDSRIQRHRQMLRAYILFMFNTGLRPGEARWLTWKSIGTLLNSQGHQVLTVKVDKEHTKVKKDRTVIGRITGYIALMRYKDYLHQQGITVSDNAFIFADDNGQPYADMLNGIQAIFAEAGVAQDENGEPYVIYTMRHSYITFRLIYGKKVDIFKLAQNCGTSVKMIEQYYSDARTTDFVDSLG